ncbi:MAG: DUF5076 domain-containing protein [Hyphomonadaceae bacterium]
MSTEGRELPPPAGASTDADATEMVRLWIGAGKSHVALNTGRFATEQEPQVWGLILADIAEHAIRDMIAADPSLGPPDKLRKSIEKTYKIRLRKSLAAAARGLLP